MVAFGRRRHSIFAAGLFSFFTHRAAEGIQFAAAASALHAQPFTSAPHLLSRIRGIETEIGHEAVRINVRRGEGRSSVAR